jgi:undecaprenyl diphosphate synthase
MHHPSERFVALIPDGGRRAVDGDPMRYGESYERGAEVVSDILKACVQDNRIKIFAAWGLSDDNAQKRSFAERTILNGIFRKYLDRLRSDVDTEPYSGVKVVHLGNNKFLHPSVNEKISDIADHTKERKEKIFAMCLGYGSHDEMNRAVHAHVVAGGETDWRQHLDLPYRGKMPYQNVDLIVRTGTDPETPYTSAYLLPYQGTKTQERYIKDYLPNITVDDFMDRVDEVFHSSERMRAGA